MNRILVINSEYPPIGGGASNASANIAEKWTQAGKQVVVLTARFAGLPREETVSGVRIIRIPAMRRSVDRSTPIEQLSFLLSSLVCALRLVRDWKPDISVAFFGVPSGPAAWLLWKLFKIPYIVSLRGGDVPGFRSYDFRLYHQAMAPLIRLIWRYSAAMVANSPGLKKLALTFYPAAEIEVISNGVDANKYRVSSRVWDPPVLLTVGRLVNQKGIHVLISGLFLIDDLDWQLIIVGDGKERSKLEALCAEYQLEDRIKFTGWKNRSELFALYKQANLYVHTSFDEGMSNAVLEAMASGLPVLATDVSGNLDVIVHRHTGILIQPGKPEAAADALRELIPAIKLRMQLGYSGQKRVMSAYTWDRVANDYLEIICKVLVDHSENNLN